MKKRRPSAPTKSRPVNVHYVLSTHWDREWYQTFQGFRHRLVRLLNRTLDDIAAGKLHGPFTTDGQSIVLDDYLEIHPEREAQVRDYVRTGKLKVGPWFVLPDEWLVSGESIVRNLELGRASARAYGAEPSNAGFVCDLFGHISQLPQILSGFGIKDALVWRGLEPRKSAHLWWESPDGTRILCYRFARTGYCDYPWDIRRSHQRDLPFDRERAERDLQASLAREAKRTGLGPLLIFDGGDHLEYDADYYRALFSRSPAEASRFRIIHSTLDAYLQEVRTHADKVTDVHRGEMRETGTQPCVQDQQWLIPGVLSSRVWIKQSNARCEQLLCHWSEPFGAAAREFTGLPSQSGFLRTAWRWLLTNHPHDSICGCSIDAVHEDMKYRFAQCQQIAENTTQESLLSLAAAITGPVGEKEVRVLVANPLTRPIDECIELTLQLPTEWGCFNEFFGFEPKPGFRLYTSDGVELPYQRVAQDMGRLKSRALPRHFPAVFRTNDVTVVVRIAVPALGYTSFVVREGAQAPKDEIVAAAMLPTRHPASPGLATSERSMENAFLSVTIESNGSLTLTDRRNGQTYTRLLTFEDSADIGDGWYHGQAVNDQVYTSTACAADVALVADGPWQATFRIRTTLNIPREFSFDRMVRSTVSEPLVIDTHVTLRRDATRLEFETVVHNTAKDHRVRVLFPSGTRTRTYLADSAFDVVERPIALPANNHLRRELAVETCAQQTWTSVSDTRRGLAVISTGLLESAVRDQADRPLALTLFRSTRRTVFTDGEPNGQLQGDLSFRFWLEPFRGAADRVHLSELGIQLGAGLRNFQLPPSGFAGLFVPVKRALPASASFLAVNGAAVVTSTRERPEGLEARCFNPNTTPSSIAFDFRGRPDGVPAPAYAEKVDLEGRPLTRRLPVRGGVLKTKLRTKEIATFRFGPTTPTP